MAGTNVLPIVNYLHVTIFNQDGDRNGGWERTTLVHIQRRGCKVTLLDVLASMLMTVRVTCLTFY